LNFTANKVNDVLAPKLLEISKLFQTSADIRFPFAERLSAFTDDLQARLHDEFNRHVLKTNQLA
jgi:hypothetical protein